MVEQDELWLLGVRTSCHLACSITDMMQVHVMITKGMGLVLGLCLVYGNLGLNDTYLIVCGCQLFNRCNLFFAGTVCCGFYAVVQEWKHGTE